MENKKDLLIKLGFSEDYLKILEETSITNDLQQSENAFYYIENQIVDSKMNSLVIDRTEKPINNHFIFNES